MKSRSTAGGIWILSAWQDLGLFVLSPVWVIPLLWLAKGRFDPNGFGSMLLAIGAAGHHLPGFIRAYTDPVLFRRFQTRFIVAPVLLLGVYLVFSAFHLQSLKLVLLLWGTWHGAMQVNGFLRIYDSKVASFAKATSWLDWAMCVAWFGGGLLYSSRLMAVFSYLFNAGIAPISPVAFTAFRSIWMVLIVGVTLAFLVNAWRQTQAGKAPSPVKLLMMTSSFALWWFAMISVSSLLVGLLLFEMVHDVQYNALVWIYNRRRVSQQMTASAVERFLFQPGVARALLYATLIVSYGGVADMLDYVKIQAPNVLQAGIDTSSFWNGLFMISTFLHFYFDGFIWQVREDTFRQGLGIRSGDAMEPARFPRMTVAALPAGWKWAFFLIPAAVLGVSEYNRTTLPLQQQARNVVELLPDRWQANAVIGSLEAANGDKGRAIQHLQHAVALNPSYSYGEAMLGNLYADRGESELAKQHYARAIALSPENYDAQERLGIILANDGTFDEALPHLQVAAEHKPADPNLYYVLGVAMVRTKKALDGIPYLRRALQLNPKLKEAYYYLGVALQTQGNLRAAADYYRQALTIDPRDPVARTNLEQVEAQLDASGK